jgi:hypothetical protein
LALGRHDLLGVLPQRRGHGVQRGVLSALDAAASRYDASRARRHNSMISLTPSS